MKKLLLLLLLPVIAFADLEVKKVGVIGNQWYVVRGIENGISFCWGMPEWTDMSYLNDYWTTLINTSVQHSWPTGESEPDVAAACSEPREVWRTWAWTIAVSSPVYAVQNIPPQMRIIGYLPDGVICGDSVTKIANWSAEYRKVNYGSTTGVALCTKRTQ